MSFEKRWLSAEQVGEPVGRDRRYVLERMACRPDFPKADLTGRPRWLAGEVLAWQVAARDARQTRRRRRSAK